MHDVRVWGREGGGRERKSVGVCAKAIVWSSEDSLGELDLSSHLPMGLGMS